MHVGMKWLACVLGAIHAAASDAHAQSAPAWFGQVAYGPAYSSGGNYFHRDAFASDALVGRAVRSSAHGALVVAVAAGAILPAGPHFGCVQICLGEMPNLFHGAALVGLTFGSVRGSASIMAGPSVIGSQEFLRLGLHVQADVTSPAVAHIALVLSPQLLLVPNIGKTQLSVRSIRLGFRLR